MRGRVAALALTVAAGAAWAEVTDETFLIGPEIVSVEVFETSEIMWVGLNEYERTQVLSGADIEVAAFLTDPEAEAGLGARAVVAYVPGTHSCDNLEDPRAYYVVTLGPTLATDGPATSCGELVVIPVEGAILLEEDPMRTDTPDGGQAIYWVPGRGFTDRLE